MSQQQARAVLIAVLLTGCLWTVAANFVPFAANQYQPLGPGWATSTLLRLAFDRAPPLRELCFSGLFWLCAMATQMPWRDTLLVFAAGVVYGHLIWGW